jgi:cysteine desulfurase/selenocysteine lyase
MTAGTDLATESSGSHLTPRVPAGDPAPGAEPYDVERVRADFPLLSRLVHGVPLVYLDNAATSQKPRVVLDAERRYYEQHNANVHRGVHTLAEEATALYEGGRDAVAAFIHAADRAEVVFTKNASEAINLVAYALGNAATGTPDQQALALRPGDEVVVTEMEHHSNIVPWQLLCQRTGATFKWLGLTDEGRLDLADLDRVVTDRTRVLAFTHQSNLLGTVNPVDVLVRRAREIGAITVLDACQSVPHMPVDVQALGVDFVAFSAHKMLGPTGLGVLWGRRELLERLPPFLGGGEMIETVRMTGSTFAPLPHRFEAGTPPIAQVVGLGAAVEYLTQLGMPAVATHEAQVTAYALDALAAVPDLRVIGPATPEARGAAISFTLGGIHPHDVGQVLDEQGVAVRVGHHCARPACDRYGVPATTRASFGPYTTRADIDALVEGLDRVRAFFQG